MQEGRSESVLGTERTSISDWGGGGPYLEADQTSSISLHQQVSDGTTSAAERKGLNAFYGIYSFLFLLIYSQPIPSTGFFSTTAIKYLDEDQTT